MQGGGGEVPPGAQENGRHSEERGGVDHLHASGPVVEGGEGNKGRKRRDREMDVATSKRAEGETKGGKNLASGRGSHRRRLKRQTATE